MNEWMNEWMNERTNERTNEWMNETVINQVLSSDVYPMHLWMEIDVTLQPLYMVMHSILGCQHYIKAWQQTDGGCGLETT